MLILVMIVSVIATSFIVSSCDKRIPFSRLLSVLEYGAEDTRAMGVLKST